MIARLEGVLRELTPTRVVVDVAGVGYEVFVPLSTFAALPDAGKTVALHVYTHVREGAIQLFGFATTQERAAFALLLRASRVGPKLAQTILSGIGPTELLEGIRTANVSLLRAAPGVGTKLAERILLELRDRTGELEVALQAGGETAPEARVDTGSETLRGQALSALLNLGYPRAQADRALTQTGDELGADGDLESLVRGALKRLMR